MRKTGSNSSSSVCVVAPLPPPYGGMSLQAEKLIARLRQEHMKVVAVPTNPRPELLPRVPGLRTLVRELQYLLSLLRRLPGCSVVHHLSASGLYFFLHSLPVLVLGRCFGKRVVLNYRGGNAEAFLRRWSWCVVPMMRLANMVVVPSPFLQRVFARYGLGTALLPNIADTELFVWKARPAFAPRLLVGRHLEPMYNVECILRAFRRVQARFPEAVLGIAGDGSEEARLRALAQEWGLRRVTFYGAVDYQDLPALYAAHDIYVNSSNVDNFPGALVEAACCGLPIVTTRAGGIPDMISDRETGLLVNLDDDAALAEGVLEILQRPDLGYRCARQARQWAQQFSWKNVFTKLLLAYGCDAPACELPLPQGEMLT